MLSFKLANQNESFNHSRQIKPILHTLRNEAPPTSVSCWSSVFVQHQPEALERRTSCSSCR